ncbi:MAG: hypothetical protein AB9891_03615 [Anaerolineaceae bacterium]
MVKTLFQQWKWILLIVGVIVLLCVGLWFGFYQFSNAPVYERLTIPSPSYYLANAGWYTEQFTMETTDNGANKFFIWRVEDFLSFSEVGVNQHYTSEDDLFATLIRWFEDHGWARMDLNDYDVCYFMPEREFLTPDEKLGYVGFRRSSKNPDAYEPTVCIAMWRDKRHQEYNFVVTTSTPSRITSLSRCLDMRCE